MRRTTLGSQGLEVSAQGLGCMGMTHAYGSGDEESGLKTIHRALELGITFLDTAEVYGPYTNEELVGRAIAGRAVTSSRSRPSSALRSIPISRSTEAPTAVPRTPGVPAKAR
jgi:aryl-alcohol dehydrogenase-like predicted oxidoreductase